jgi:hypothetical protein
LYAGNASRIGKELKTIFYFKLTIMKNAKKLSRTEMKKIVGGACPVSCVDSCQLNSECEAIFGIGALCQLSHCIGAGPSCMAKSCTA